MKLLILAQNPKTERNKTSPLKGTKSWTILERWLKEAGIPEDALDLDNALLTFDSKTLIKKQIQENTLRWTRMLIQYPVIVTLGNVAEEAITRTRELYFPNVKEWDHYFLPHPSGLNRKLNEPEAHHEAVKQLKAAYVKLLTLKIYEGRI